jgi:uncharacterized membrane protein YqhA
MSRILINSRYLVLLPILGLAIAAAFFFIFGGIGLIRLLFNLLLYSLGFTDVSVEMEQGLIIFEVVEFVHTFLVGTVLYITTMGLYQLFVREIDFPDWLKIDSTEELETNLIGVTVVVLAVNFMGAIFAGNTDGLLEYGAGIALPIAALGIFIGLRSWSARIQKESESSKKELPPTPISQLAQDVQTGSNDPSGNVQG